jgi:hypothetical protein
MRSLARERRPVACFSAALMIVAVGLAIAHFGASRAQAAGAQSGPETASLPARAVVQPVIGCSSLPGAYQQLAGAPASITSASLVGTAGAQYCDVTGWIAPQTAFEVHLPTSTWQGRYLQLGCGGNCGVVSFGVAPAADTGLALTDNTFVVATDNEGHTSTGLLDVWAAGGETNPLRVQFGFLADHLTAIVAKHLIETFYGQAPAYSYFDGYSDGGRTAIMEAQRYPHDFNGIVAGAPAIEITYAMESFIWAADHLLTASGQPIFDTAAITTLHNAAVAACDGTDGLVDGQISDPRLCHWNPSTIECSSTLTANCLTPQQVAAAQAMYAGPTTTNGTYLWPGGEAYGSELAWPSFAGAGEFLGTSFTKYMLFPQDRPPDYTYQDFKFDVRTWEEMADMSKVYNSNNFNHPDLDAFDRAGGKLIVWQSWEDEAAGPYSTLDWYAQVEDRAGGLRATQNFARVFMLPGGSHGQTASGVPYDESILPNLVGWVETGQAPQEITATETNSSGNVARTYPLYPYPARAKYIGSGNVDDASNWVPAIPNPLPNDHFNWLGDPAGGHETGHRTHGR